MTCFLGNALLTWYALQVLITKHGEVADGEYLDPRGNQVISYDHIKQEVTGARAIDGELETDVEPYR